jgi:signal transduction histidine kinase
MNTDQNAILLRRPLRVLLVEDSETDALLLLRALQRAGFDPDHARVDSAREMDSALKDREWDLILADHSMPQFSAPEALELVKNNGLDIPFLIVSGHIDEETAVRAMMAGAHDYVMKDRLARLAPAVERELREADIRRARRETEAALRAAHDELELRVGERTAALQASNLKLQHVLEERKRLENELLEIAENERRRIGFDLHDDLGQKLTGISMMIKGLAQKLAVDKHASAAQAETICSLVEEVTSHTHNLAQECSDLDAQGEDLPKILKELASKVTKTLKTTCTSAVKGSIPALLSNVSTQLYKISQEAVNNSIKHGKAKRISITLASTNDGLLLTIKNDGEPFSEAAAAKNRLGLRIMNYRANTIGATLDIRPLDKKGTIVSCSLSLKQPSQPPSARTDSVRKRPTKAASKSEPAIVAVGSK